VQGVVIEARSRLPVAWAQVELVSNGAGGRWSTYSGRRGEFAFSELPAGAYRLEARKEGYATAVFGASSCRPAGRWLQLAGSDSIQVELALPRLGAIEGSVVDENGLGVAGVTVTAYRAASPPRPVRSTVTDDRGVYRLGLLEPGYYLVRTSSKSLPTGEMFLPTYYGDATGLSGARIVHVRLDEEAQGIDIAARVGAFGTIEGTVEGGAARQVLLLGDGILERKPLDDGRFRFTGLVAGEYALVVEPQDAGGRVAFRSVVVEPGRTTQVVVRLERPPVLQLRCNVATLPGAAAQAVSVFLRRWRVPEPPRRLLCNQQVSWEPGDWEVAVSSPPHWYVASLGGAARWEAGKLTLLAGTSEELVVELREGPAVIRGRLLCPSGGPAAGARVWVSSLDPELRARLGGRREAAVDEEGKYELGGLPPGELVLLGGFGEPPEDPGQWLLEGAVRVVAEAGTVVEADLVVPGS